MTERKYTITDPNGQTVGYLVLYERATAPNLVGGGWRPAALLESKQHLHTEAATLTPADLGDWQKVTPVGRLTPTDVKTSVLDAAVIAGYVALGAAGASWYFGWPWLVTPAAGFIAFGWRYWGGMSLARNLLEVVETVTHRATTTPQPEPARPEPQTVRVEVKSDKGQHWQFADLDADPANLQAFARLILSGEGFTERTGRQAGLTQEQIKNLRDQFVSRGWAAWKNPDRKQTGIELKHSGRWVLKAIVNAPLPPVEPV